jgi:hypothetical protein
MKRDVVGVAIIAIAEWRIVTSKRCNLDGFVETLLLSNDVKSMA